MLTPADTVPTAEEAAAAARARLPEDARPGWDQVIATVAGLVREACAADLPAMLRACNPNSGPDTVVGLFVCEEMINRATAAGPGAARLLADLLRPLGEDGVELAWARVCRAYDIR